MSTETPSLDDKGSVAGEFKRRPKAKGTPTPPPKDDAGGPPPFADESVPPCEEYGDAAGTIAHLTDMGNAHRLTRWFGEDLRYVGTWEKWLCWRGSHWRLDDTCQVERLAQRTATRMGRIAAAEIAAIQARSGMSKEARDAAIARAKARLAWALKTEMSARLTAMVATAEPLVAINHQCLDADPFSLPCINGTVDLRTGVLRPSRREDLLTKLCPHEFDPSPRCPVWEATLAKIFRGDGDLAAYFQRLVGYCLTGSAREAIVAILYGDGSNGKSLVSGILHKLLGADYAGVGPDELLRSDRDQGHPTALAKLYGMRLVTLAESSEDGRLNEALVKKLSGGDRIQARRMREDFWEFDPTHKIMLATNHKPKIGGTDHGIWRRIRLVPFEVKFWDPAKKETGPPELEADKLLPEKLASEMVGILAWAVRGCLEWQRVGLNEPAAVTRATEEYREEQDTVASFFADCCTLGPERVCAVGGLYNAFKEWHDETKRPGRVMSRPAFSDRICQRKDVVKLHKSGGIVRFRGVSLTGDVDGGVHPPGGSSPGLGEDREQNAPYPESTSTSPIIKGNRQFSPCPPQVLATPSEDGISEPPCESHAYFAHENLNWEDEDVFADV